MFGVDGHVERGKMSEHPSVQRAREILELARNPVLRDLVRYWLAIHPGPVLPGRQHFDPIDVPRALRNLVLTEVEREPFRFRVRLMGTAVVAAFGADYTGTYLDQSIENFERSFGHIHRVEAAESGLPNYRYGEPSLVFKLDFAPVERVHLPLATDGERVDMLLSMTVYMAAKDFSSQQ